MKKEDIYIRTLLDKYFDGLTSLAEEKELSNFFSTLAEVPEDLAYAKELFGFFADESERQFTPKKSRRKRSTIYILSTAAAVAASLIIAVTVQWNMNRKQQQNETVYCYINGKAITDRETAVLETRHTLGMVTGNMQTKKNYREAMTEVNKSLNKINEAKEILRMITDNLN